ncbi:MAG: hypothetical protein H0U54_14635 [Acidobacteria bacterium]|nr:hypothetical protein [Acidobacteriota bacterium]
MGFKEWLRKFGMIAAVIVLVTAFAIAGIYRWKRGRNLAQPSESATSENNALPNAIDLHQLAVNKVEADRGEPTGNKARINIPAELKLYKDTKRFLAIQVAEWRKHKFQIPHDFSELASMVQQGEFTILPPLTPDYILYGVGLKADGELTHYDQKTGKSAPLFRDETEIENELGRLNTAFKEFETKARELKTELARMKNVDRSQRAETLRQITTAQKSAAATETRRDLITSFYKSEEHRKVSASEYQKLAELSRSFDGVAYDLNEAVPRKKLKMRLLSGLRPSALRQLAEIAKAYREKFDRPLPVTSLVRTIEYQWQLGDAGNPNATRIDVPPHTTGLAFDIFTFYMSGAEQQFLIDEIARLEREGRLEALRENRNHIHVFAFADAKPPEERLIQESVTMKSSEESNEQE